jgi:acyl-coenzyme A synthetase/AMP-(fatty) acid ligase
MSRDAFRRLALVAACCALVVALGLVWIHVGWLVALAAAVLGPLAAGAMTLEEKPPAPPETRRGL